MKKFKGTPGEWKVNKTSESMHDVYNPDFSNWFIAENIKPKDAKLIAAAPELLDALEHFLESENEIKHYLGFDKSILDAIEKGKNAINKAL